MGSGGGSEQAEKRKKKAPGGPVVSVGVGRRCVREEAARSSMKRCRNTSSIYSSRGGAFAEGGLAMVGT